MAQDNLNLEFRGALSRHEEKLEVLDGRVDDHDTNLEALGKQLDTLVKEVRQIRNALYFLALSVAANIPALSHLTDYLRTILLR